MRNISAANKAAAAAAIAAADETAERAWRLLAAAQGVGLEFAAQDLAVETRHASELRPRPIFELLAQVRILRVEARNVLRRLIHVLLGLRALLLEVRVLLGDLRRAPLRRDVRQRAPAPAAAQLQIGLLRRRRASAGRRGNQNAGECRQGHQSRSSGGGIHFQSPVCQFIAEFISVRTILNFWAGKAVFSTRYKSNRVRGSLPAPVYYERRRSASFK